MFLIENMTRFCFFTQFLLLCFAAFPLASGSNPVKVMPQSHRTAGVFMLIEGENYTFNFTAATAACLSLNVSMATREQMERALQHGLETCKYGWTAEQIAVIPRLKADKNCGKGKTGVVTWLTSTDKEFAVFCFNASDLEETPNTSTVSPQSSTFPTTLTSPTGSSTPATPATPLLRQSSRSPPSGKLRTTKAPEQTSFTSAFTLLFKTAHSTRIPTTSTAFKTFSTPIPTSLSRLITSKPVAVSFALSTSVHASSFSVFSESALPPPVSPAKPLGDVPTALIILGIILLLLTAAGVVWYCKLRNIFTFWSQGQQKDDIETEMWKHTNSETDLHSQHEGGEEEEEEEEEDDESDWKYSSDITLCVNPHIKINSSE